eukprot:SAG22_NODE_475_length_10003_cov_3.943356_8_plen_55_part_00
MGAAGLVPAVTERHSRDVAATATATATVTAVVIVIVIATVTMDLIVTAVAGDAA